MSKNYDPDPHCLLCLGTGACDSGGVTPWGASIDVRCDCTYYDQPLSITFGNLFTPRRDGI
jgi:hypothetical protein